MSIDWDRESYIAMADEFDAHGRTAAQLVFRPDEWDPDTILEARNYAEKHDIPLPWDIQSVDIALDYVRSAERDPA